MSFKSIIPDLLLIAGAAAVAYGAWLAYEPAGYAVAGGFAIMGGLLLAKGA